MSKLDPFLSLIQRSKTIGFQIDNDKTIHIQTIQEARKKRRNRKRNKMARESRRINRRIVNGK